VSHTSLTKNDQKGLWSDGLRAGLIKQQTQLAQRTSELGIVEMLRV
jgi:hypothetical protein